jgi:CDP-glucose 4,6-dehydratase
MIPSSDLAAGIRHHALRTVIMVTTDKCYENREWLHPYRESDPMGGHDPYSVSKGAAEIAIAAYRRSFFNSPHSPVRVASARAGNVIGGGDWAPDRFVPDALTSSFNFGPAVSANQSVGSLVAALLSRTGGSWTTAADPSAPHEASRLHLATEKAYHLLGWEPAWQFPDTVRMTASWYLQSAKGSDPADLTRSQILDCAAIGTRTTN